LGAVEAKDRRYEEMTPGTKLGPYEIVGAIGAGGMGEVYRARDPKLGRDVAIKVLPEAFARDAERMARFQREAKVLASLSHPNIATIYGLEDSGSTRALVMELVERSSDPELLLFPIDVCEAGARFRPDQVAQPDGGAEDETTITRLVSSGARREG